MPPGGGPQSSGGRARARGGGKSRRRAPRSFRAGLASGAVAADVPNEKTVI